MCPFNEGIIKWLAVFRLNSELEAEQHGLFCLRNPSVREVTVEAERPHRDSIAAHLLTREMAIKPANSDRHARDCWSEPVISLLEML